MAKIKYATGISEVIGALNKSSEGIVQRRKHFRGPNGDITREGRIEAYVIHNPRDFKTKPAKGAELAHQTSFGAASREANELIRAVKNGNASALQKSKHDQLAARYYAQLKGTPDPAAPLDENGKGQIYGSFNCFVRSMLYYDRRH